MSILSEPLLTLTEAAKRLPGRPTVSTLHRWRLRGVGGVKLRTIKIGGRRFVSQSALDEFVRRTTAAADGRPAPVHTERRRQQAIVAAERELAQAGIISSPRQPKCVNPATGTKSNGLEPV